MTVELTTVTDDTATFHDGTTVDHVTGLEADSHHEAHGITFRTLPTPPGTLRCRIGTVNDVHFGEVEAGRIDDNPLGPVRRAGPDESPYPETMNRSAADEMVAAGLDAVVVKGDLSTDGTPEEFAEFERIYRASFVDRLHVARGNHDAYRGQHDYAGDEWIELPGLAVALLDTAVPTQPNGHVSSQQLEWLDALATASTVPVLAMGHHQQWVSGRRSPDYFGIDPDSSDALTEVMLRRPAIVAYTAGHTHRHRVRLAGGTIPSIEVGCVKDFPGTWAEYRAYDGGILQIVHRISTPEALAWSEQCRTLYSDFGLDYAAYAMGTLADRCFVIPFR